MELHPNQDITNEKIASFDCTYTSNHIRMLKILLYYIPHNFKKHLAFYIKFLELQQVFSASGRASFSENLSDESNPYAHMSALLEELLPFCSASEEQKFKNMGQFLNSFEQIKNMMEMFEMFQDMKDMFGDGEGGFDPDMLSGILGIYPPNSE